MSGYQRRIKLDQIEGWPDQGESSLIDRLNSMDDNIFFEFTQKNESTIWQVTHSLGFLYPDVRIIDDKSNIIIGDINYITNNYLEIKFSFPTAGIAYIRK